jgi:hypothetical protein
MAFADWFVGLCYAWTFRRDSCTGPHLFDHPVHGRLWCCRCHQERPALFPAPCADHPELEDAARGNYWCADCGARLLASFPHPLLCRACIERFAPVSPGHCR